MLNIFKQSKYPFLMLQSKVSKYANSISEWTDEKGKAYEDFEKIILDIN